MKSKNIYFSTLALALIGGLTSVQGAFAQEAARGDYEPGAWRSVVAPNSGMTRAQALAERQQAAVARSALVGPQKSALYNTEGAGVLVRSSLPRADVKRETREAMARHEIPRTDYDQGPVGQAQR